MQSSFARFAVVVAVCAVFFYEWYFAANRSAWPECSQEDKAEFVRQLGAYTAESPAELTSKRRELKGECMFSKDYKSARQSFLEKGMRLRQSNFEATLSGYKIGEGTDGENKSGVKLVTDYVIVRGSKKKFMFSFSGVHGPEGFAGSAVQQGVVEYFLGDKELMNRYTEAAVLRDQQRQAGDDSEELDEMSLPPTLVIVHAINPFGMANNRRVNEDNIDLNRNYLHKELLAEALAREPNHAGYVSANFFINPTSMPSQFLLVNDVYGYLTAAGALLRFGLEGVKKALLGGNYFDPKGQGYGGTKQSASVHNMIKLLREVDVSQAEKVSLVDLHTGLGPSGTDTLAILQPGEKKEGMDKFNEYVESVFPEERDPAEPRWWSGRKALKSDSRSAGNPMSGYDLTIGTVDNYCNHYLAPHLADGNDLVCVTQEFGTVPVVQVGMASRDENFAWHYGTAAQQRLYGERLKHVFFVQERAWMRSVVHRGLSVFKQAFQAADDAKR